MLVYDIKRPETLQSIFDRWLPQYLQSKYHNHIDWEQSTKERQKLIYLIGNKADEDSDEAILALLKTNRFLVEKYDIKQLQFSALNGRKFSEFVDSIYNELITGFLPDYHIRKQIEESKKYTAVKTLGSQSQGGRNLLSCCRIL